MKYFSTCTCTSLCANFSLVKTGSDLSKFVQTDHDMSRLGQTGYWFTLVQTCHLFYRQWTNSNLDSGLRSI